MPKRILVVEDNPDDAFFLTRALNDLDLSIELDVCAGSEEALFHLFSSGKPLPHIVFLDLKLLHTSGHEVLAAIRSDVRTKTLPVVIVSGSEAVEDVVKSYSLGANSHVRKPLGGADFEEKVKQVAKYWISVNAVPLGNLPATDTG